MGILLNRDVSVYIDYEQSTGSAVKFPILSGYAISNQDRIVAARSSAQHLNPTGSRTVGNKYVEEVTPTQFSFTSYVDWELDTIVKTPQSILWESLVGSTAASSAISTEYSVDFGASNVARLMPFKIWFEWANEDFRIYLNNCTIDRAEIDLDINKIASITWYGTALEHKTGTGTSFEPPEIFTYYSHENCLLNKYSTLEFNVGSFFDFNFPLLSTKVTFNNNNQYYTRSQVGNSTITSGCIPGAIDIKANLNTYLRTGTGNVEQLLDLTQDFRDRILEFPLNMKLNIGGNVRPYLELDTMPGSESTMLFKFPQVKPGDSLTAEIQLESKNSGDYPTLKYKI